MRGVHTSTPSRLVCFGRSVCARWLPRRAPRACDAPVYARKHLASALTRSFGQQHPMLQSLPATAGAHAHLGLPAPPAPPASPVAAAMNAAATGNVDDHQGAATSRHHAASAAQHDLHTLCLQRVAAPPLTFQGQGLALYVEPCRCSSSPRSPVQCHLATMTWHGARKAAGWQRLDAPQWVGEGIRKA